jgi:uncharacterized low-complexity protein
MKKQITKSGILTGTIIAAILLAFTFTAQANVSMNDIQSNAVELVVTPDGEKIYDTKCSGESKEAKKSDKKSKSGAVSADKKTTEEGKCGEGKCGEGKTHTDKKASTEKVSSDKKAKSTEGKCGEGKCGEGKCGVSKH